MYTEQQERLQTALIDLATLAPRIIRIRFLQKRESSREQPPKTEAVRNGFQVWLSLVEAYTFAEFDQWAQAIAVAEELIGLIEKEKAHMYSNPNFFQAISSRLYDVAPQVTDSFGMK
jgi:hypothetical protein